jgi:hypothetical protein
MSFSSELAAFGPLVVVLLGFAGCSIDTVFDVVVMAAP